MRHHSGLVLLQGRLNGLGVEHGTAGGIDAQMDRLGGDITERFHELPSVNTEPRVNGVIQVHRSLILFGIDHRGRRKQARTASINSGFCLAPSVFKQLAGVHRIRLHCCHLHLLSYQAGSLCPSALRIPARAIRRRLRAVRGFQAHAPR